ncbi:hypothetical protein PLESTB_001034700 [Pleodorina starrii]|uniref:Uncharacterized protein n=1 Tax=Pleodorina starrii TaxID=330485 RepID=A0A9W6F478_9CHLO|nr:hypothetical protein PLESTB_001034700 [Pleodorina starrii]
MRASLQLRTPTTGYFQKQHAVAVPGAAALAVRPNPVDGKAQPLVVCHLGICPLHLNDAQDYVRLEPPLTLRNHNASKFNIRNVHDAAYDHHSGLVLFTHGSAIFGLDCANRVTQVAGDDEGGLIFDGPAAEARFVGAQRLAPDGRGVTYIRDRDSGSRNGFCLRALYEATLPHGSGGSGDRAVVTVHIGGNVGPHAMTYDRRRRSLLFATRGRAVHELLSYGITQELLGTDEPPAAAARTGAAAAAASASSSPSDYSDDEAYDSGRPTPAATPPPDRLASPLTNVQALAADADSGNVYILDGTTGSRTMLRVLRPDGSLDTLDEPRIGPAGSSRWPRLAVLPYGHLAVYGVSGHEMMVLTP